MPTSQTYGKCYMREREIALRAHTMHLFHGALHWILNIVLKAVPLITGVTTQKTDSPPLTLHCFKLQWQFSPTTPLYPLKNMKRQFLKAKSCNSLTSRSFLLGNPHIIFIFFLFPFCFLLADPEICAFAACFVLTSFLLVSKSAAFRQHTSTVMHFHGNYSGAVPISQTCVQPTLWQCWQTVPAGACSPGMSTPRRAASP